MLKIPQSHINALPFDFKSAVDAHIAALKAHQTTEGQPAPSAPHGLVEAVIARKQHPADAGRPDDFVPDYEIIDDTPSLEERKNALVHEVNVALREATKAIVPPLKEGLWAFQVADAHEIEEAKRTAVHRSTISQHEDRSRRLHAARRHAAEMYSEIHDLTEQTVGNWKMVPFT